METCSDAIVLTIHLLLQSVLQLLQGGVAEEHNGAENHGLHADTEGDYDEGDHEAQGLPHPVVGEGCLLLRSDLGQVGLEVVQGLVLPLVTNIGW